MASQPWSKFFWSDWRADPALRLCSMAARGFWMELLCIAAEADPTGYVLVNGTTPTTTDLALLTGAPEADVESWLAELDRNGVFSRDRNGRIYSRRIVREVKKARTARKNGKMGGNPNLCKKEAISASDNPQVNVGDKPHKPEAISQNQKTLYAWQGRVGRLTADDLAAWRSQFANLDDAELRRELMKADAYYADHPPKDGKWFYPFHRWLDKANADATGRPRKRSHPMFGTPEWARAQVDAGITLEPQYEHLLGPDRARKSGG